MGDRGASSGRSVHGNEYGTQYTTLFSYGNIKFVKNNTRQSEALKETMTKNRIYASVGGNELVRIVLFDNTNKRNKVFERDKHTDEWHMHYGYEHTEHSEKEHINEKDMHPNDKALLDKVRRIWYNHRNKI